jgi:hypothetical protein
MNLLKVEKQLNVRERNSKVQLELLKLHKPPQKSGPPPKRSWKWLWQIFELFSVRGSASIHREVGPEFRPERVERKEGRPRFY